MAMLTVEQLSSLAADLEPVRRRMSYEEFLAWSDEDTHAEWVPLDNLGNGEVIIYMPPKNIHQMTLAFLHELLSLFVRLFDLGRVGIAPFEVKLKPDGSAREPDIFFVAKENLNRFSEDRLNGPADLVIEIVSKSSVKIDRDDKYKEYRDAGVGEYWIVDPRPERRRADFYYLGDTGEYQLFGTEEDERIESRVLAGFWLRPDWLWQVDTLDPFLIFCEIAGLPETVVNQIREQMKAGFKRSD